jgi:predicted small metal-binding protein
MRSVAGTCEEELNSSGEHGTSQVLQLACKDMGFDCGVVLVAKTESELEQQIRVHAHDFHGVEPSDFTPELLRKVKAEIRRV